MIRTLLKRSWIPAAVCALLVARDAHAITLNFSSVPGATVRFTGTGKTFQFVDSTTVGFAGSDFRVTLSDGAGDSIGLLGNLGGTFTIGTITISGPIQNAPVTGVGSFSIFDGSTSLTATAQWTSIRTFGTSGGINAGGSINLSAISYSGANADLQALAASAADTGIATVSFQFVPAKTLTQLTTAGAVNSTTYSGTVFVVSGAIGDFVWQDLNQNGIQDPGEPGIDGVTVILKDNTGTIIDTTVTSGGGKYEFTGLAAGTYSVLVDASSPPLAGMMPTLTNVGVDPEVDSNPNPATVVLATNTSVDKSIDFGFIPTPAGSIGDFVWKDTNGDGIQGSPADEPGIPGVTVQLFQNDVLIDTRVTDADGYYLFTGLSAGTYTVTIDPDQPALAGFAATQENAPLSTTANDSNSKPSTVVLPLNTSSDTSVDFGFVPPSGQIGDFVWNDVNRNGIQDSGEPGINGVIVQLKDGDGNTIDSTTTGPNPSVPAENGYYQFIGQPAGSYIVYVDPGQPALAGFLATQVGASGSNAANDSNPDPAPVALPSNLSLDETIDFGFYQAFPAITIVKMTNGTDNDTAPGIYVPIGSMVTWTYLVTNTGNVALSNVTVTDDKIGAVGGPVSLALGASTTFTKTGTAVAGQYTNVGTVTGTSPTGSTVSATNPDNYFGANPAITIVKMTNGTDNDTAPGPTVAVGSTVTWTYLVTNTGNVALSNVTVTDDKIGAVGGPVSLAVGASTTFTKTGTAVAGQYTNVGTVTGTSPTGSTVSATNPDNYFGSNPAITIVKETNGTDNDVAPGPTVAVGSTVTWTYLVTNTGNVALSNVTVTDDKIGAVGGPISLAVGASTTFTKTGTAVAGQYTNVGTVTGTSPTGATVSATNPDNYFGSNPAITIVKETNGTDNDTAPGPTVAIGSTVTWTYLVTNTGNVALSNVTVTDDKIGAVGGPVSLALGASTTFTKTGTAVAGQYTNVGTVTGTSPTGSTVSATNPDNYFGASPAITIVKKTNGTDNDTAPGPTVAVGSTVTWTYLVTNTGNVALSNVTVTDDKTGAVGGPISLAVGASTTFTKTGTAVAGQYTNVGTVTGTSPTGSTVSATNPDNYFGSNPAITIVKKTNGTDNDTAPGPTVAVGSTVTWTYLVTNTGNVALSNVTVTDDKTGAVGGPISLAVGASTTFTKTGTAVAGQYTNVGTVTGTSPTGSTVSATNPDNYFGSNPAITIVKKTNGTNNDTAPGIYVAVGSTVTWTYTVTNTGNVALSNVTVTDDKIGAVGGPVSLAVGASTTFTKTGTACAGQYTNIGTVTAKTPSGTTLTATNPDNYYGVSGSIGDFVWKDNNSNGIQNSGEPGICGVTVTLQNSSGSTLATTTTSSNGHYQFTGLAAGTYYVVVNNSQSALNGLNPTTVNASGSTTANDSNPNPAKVVLATNSSSDQTIDFGYKDKGCR